MAKEEFLDELAKGFGDAVNGIRQKAVEEPWFGRAVTEQNTQEQTPQWPQAEPQPSLGSSTHTRDVAPEHDRDSDIDR